VIVIHSVDCTTGTASLGSPSTARATPTDLNPRRSAGTERFLGEEIAQRCAPREVLGTAHGALSSAVNFLVED
jgi:hypothetical protein